MSRKFECQSSSVLQLTSSLEIGGAERLLIEFVKSCAEKPQIPQVIVVMNDRVDQHMVNELKSASIRAHYLRRPEGSKNPRYIYDLMKIVRQHRVSVIHSHTPGAKYWAALCCVLKFDLKLAHTFHNTRIPMKRSEVRFHNLMVDATIAISRAVAKAAWSLKIRRVEQIENGVPISLFHSVSPKPLGPRAKLICVGRLFPEEKGQDVLIRAMRRCVDRGLNVECTFVGNPAAGDSQTLPMLQDLTSALQLEDRVHFVQGRTDVATLLAEANLFVLPSRYEGFGLALVEAMAAGLPVIAADLGGPREIVADEIDGLLFEPGSDEHLAEKIARLIQSPDLADKLRDNGRAKSGNYDIGAMRDKYMAVYRRLMAAG
jgi:glycosyltransferase involved in cell wall biosynthesis